MCGKDPDGLAVATLDGEDFLAINGVQTLSHSCATTLRDLDSLVAAGIASFRLSPPKCDMLAVVRLYRDRVAGAIDGEEALVRLRELQGFASLSNGFLFGAPGAELVVGDL